MRFSLRMHIGNMRAEDAPVGVHFIDDDEAQAAEEFHPVGVVRQDAGVKHVGVGQDDARLLADGERGPSEVCRRRRWRLEC